MKHLISWVLFVALLTFLGLLANTQARGADVHAFSLKKFSLDIGKIADNTDSYFPYADPDDDTTAEKWYGTVATKFDIDLLKVGDWGLFWNNRVFGDGTRKQFRQVGWEFRAGIQLGRKLTLYFDHTSRHILEATSPYPYPQRNVYGGEITLYERAPDKVGAKK